MEPSKRPRSLLLAMDLFNNESTVVDKTILVLADQIFLVLQPRVLS